MGKTSFHVWLPWLLTRITQANYNVRFSPPYILPSPCPVEGVIKSRYMLTRIKYFKIFPSSYTCIVMTPYFYFMILKFICRYTKYLWIIKLSRTEVHFIFVLMSKLSYLPLLSMLKNGKNDVTFETTSVVPNQGDMVFLLAWFVDTTLLDTLLQCKAILYSDFSQ